MMETEGDSARTTVAMAVARMWKDPEYKRQFISDPKSALSNEGINFAEHTLVRVVEETPAIKYVDIGSGEQGTQEVLRRFFPLPEGQEVRIVQSTENLRYLVLPSTPAWIAPGATTGELSEMAKQSPVTSESSVEAQATASEQTLALTSMAMPIVQQNLEMETEVGVVAEATISETQVIDSQQLEVAQIQVQEFVSMEAEAEVVATEAVTVHALEVELVVAEVAEVASEVMTGTVA